MIVIVETTTTIFQSLCPDLDKCKYINEYGIDKQDRLCHACILRGERDGNCESFCGRVQNVGTEVSEVVGGGVINHDSDDCCSELS